MIMLACNSTDKKSVSKDNYLVPKGRLRSVIDSFVQVAGNNHPYYEIYINKRSPFESDIIIYSGNRSLTTLENKLEGQFPLVKTQAMGVTFDIYSGDERYFNRPENVGKEGELQDESKKPEEIYAMWAVKDSAGRFNIYSPSSAYPFLPIVDPVPDSLLKFTPPVVPTDDNK
jgi:hypothetical protein